ncbi:hypothetical protein WJX81_003357 [Elliptochloris bilobata]|uniref:RWP-RK domain-containing protein n=1 Tax=Elliptochloris bilobata TaxID=381761 RepID=A0AAW1RCY2_9CHLO
MPVDRRGLAAPSRFCGAAARAGSYLQRECDFETPAGFADDLQGYHTTDAEPALLFVPWPGFYYSTSSIGALPGSGSYGRNSLTDDAPLLPAPASVGDNCDGKLRDALPPDPEPKPLRERGCQAATQRVEPEDGCSWPDWGQPGSCQSEPDTRDGAARTASQLAVAAAAAKKRCRRPAERVLTVQELQEGDYFDVPVEAAAERLCMSKTTFNKQIRALQIHRWPYRKRSSLHKLAAEVVDALKDARTPDDCDAMQQVLQPILAQIYEECEDHMTANLSPELAVFRQKMFKYNHANGLTSSGNASDASSSKGSPRASKCKAPAGSCAAAVAEDAEDTEGGPRARSAAVLAAARATMSAITGAFSHATAPRAPAKRRRVPRNRPWEGLC